MKRTLILIISIMFTLSIYSQVFTTKSVKVEYIISDNGMVIPSKADLTISNDKITVYRNGVSKYWNVEYKGIKTAQDGGFTFRYHVFYLIRQKVYFIISDRKEVKHGDIFYYRINFDGETQLAL